MTALALPAPRLVGADILKLRKRYGLAVVVGLLTVGAVVVTYTVIELLHLTSPATHGPAGGVDNVGHGMFLVAALGAAAAAIVGSTVGAGDRDAGVYRDLAVTGRSRVSLYLARIPAGFAFLFPFVAIAYTVTAVVGVALAGSNPVPGTRMLVLGGLWTVLQIAFYYLLALGIACIVGSRSYTIAIVLAWRLALTPLIASVSALGIVRELVPAVGLQKLAPAGLEMGVRMFPRVGISLGATVAVLVVWTGLALVLGGWRDATRDA
jgi:hypothetical protein